MPGTFRPPDEFDFTTPERWPAWRDRFQRYRLASGLHKDDGEVQVAALIYAMGPQAEHIIHTLNLSAEDSCNYGTVVEKLDSYFIPKRNYIAERQAFESRCQAANESSECFMRSLYALAEHCDFENQHERIRDRLIAGMKNKELSMKIQLRAMDEDITLEKVVTMMRNMDIVNNGQEPQQNVDRIGSSRPQSGPSRPNRGYQEVMQRYQHSDDRSYSNGRTQAQQGTCKYCGRDRHSRPQECPAKGRICNKCKKRDHFAAVCLSRLSAREVECEWSPFTPPDDQGSSFIGDVDEATVSQWTILAQVNKQNVKFKVDSGADVSILSWSDYVRLGLPQLQPAMNTLRSVGKVLDVEGKVKARVHYKGKVLHSETFYVLKTCSENLLSRSASSHLSVLQFAGEVSQISEGVFGETGLMKTTPISIELSEGAVPSAVNTARNIPIPLMSGVKRELERMEKDGILETVTEPTDWCAPMVPVRKANGEVRITVDYRRLNKAIKRAVYPIPTLEDLTSKLSGATLFSKLDASSGFFQLPLDPASSLLTTFITPFGRKAFTRLPMGVSLGPECFQRKMQEMLENLPGVLCYMDDIVCYGDDSTHDDRLREVLKRIEESGLRLNKRKCQLKQNEITFLGLKISKHGIQPDEEKLEAITKMQAPRDVGELRSLLGTVNYLCRFVPNIQENLRPLYDLLRKDTAWLWTSAQQEALDRVKRLLTSAPVLAFYDPAKETVVSADASSYGLGGCIMQKHGNELKPVAYCSRTLTETERKWAQIEKELLAATWTCEKMHMFLSGLPKFQLQLDHKPLIPLINSRNLVEAPLRCQRLLMRLMAYNAYALFVPGKQHVLPDFLSRFPGTKDDEISAAMISEVHQYCAAAYEAIPATLQRLKEISQAQKADSVLQQVVEQTLSGWKEGPKHHSLSEYFAVRGQLTVIYTTNGTLLMNGRRLVIPPTLQREMLHRLHDDGHFGLNKSRERAQQSVWWPGISTDLKRYVTQCSFCQINSPKQHKEPLVSSPIPARPWSHVAADICHSHGATWLVTVDIFSRYLEIQRLPGMTSTCVVECLKTLFSQHGIPDLLTTDGGTQFTSATFEEFKKFYTFQHRITDPHHPSSNGAAERAVRTAKWLLKQKDWHLALLNYRATPIESIGCSPAKLLMGRDIQTRLPVARAEQPEYQAARDKDQKGKEKTEKSFNKRYGAKPLPELKPGATVRVKTDTQSIWSDPVQVVTKTGPRSYTVQQGGMAYRRNRRHLKPTESVGLQHQHSSPLQSATPATGAIRPEYWPAPLPAHQSCRAALGPGSSPAAHTQRASSAKPGSNNTLQEEQSDFNRNTERRTSAPEDCPTQEVKSFSPRVTRSGRRFGA